MFVAITGLGPCVRFLVVVGLLTLSACAAPFRTVIVLTQSEIQEKAEKKFPVEERALIAKVRLEDPKVLLEEGSDRLGLELTARVILGPIEYPGRIGVDGRLHYDPKRGEFFLVDATVTRVNIPALEETYADQVREAASVALKGVLPNVPIYSLDSPREKSAKMFIQSVRVKNGKVMVEMGLM